MAKNWYVIHTYAGFEGRVKTSLLERANQMGLVEKLGQVLVPTEDVIEIKDGKRRTSRRKFFPGYVIVELESPAHRRNLADDQGDTEGHGICRRRCAADAFVDRRGGVALEAG